MRRRSSRVVVIAVVVLAAPVAWTICKLGVAETITLRLVAVEVDGAPGELPPLGEPQFSLRAHASGEVGATLHDPGGGKVERLLRRKP